MGNGPVVGGRPRPITPYAGSWAQSQQNPRAYAAHAAQRDTKKKEA